MQINPNWQLVDPTGQARILIQRCWSQSVPVSPPPSPPPNSTPLPSFPLPSSHRQLLLPHVPAGTLLIAQQLSRRSPR
eukprot:757017-Hanusia_phi.AAC.2